MSVPCIDAEYKGEERYTKIALAYANEDQYVQINTALKDVLHKCELERDIYTSDITDGRKVVVVEFHDDYDREGGVILDRLIKILDIKECLS